MEALEKVNKEHLVDFDDLPNFCPNCGRPVERGWLHLTYDEARQVRKCEICDIAWIDKRPE